MTLEPWQRAIALRESTRLDQFIRRWRRSLLARIRAGLQEDIAAALRSTNSG